MTEKKTTALYNKSVNLCDGLVNLLSQTNNILLLQQKT